MLTTAGFFCKRVDSCQLGEVSQPSLARELWKVTSLGSYCPE